LDLLVGAGVSDLADALRLWPEVLEELAREHSVGDDGAALARALNYAVNLIDPKTDGVVPASTSTPARPANAPSTPAGAATSYQRPPVVAVLGHVDHGKTTLLDAIRGTSTREAGGITQRASASEVTHQGRRVTLLDTPGHAAFSSMRSRGAEVADVVVLVVALDDGVRPQTLEALEHVKRTGSAFVVALTKSDAPGADAERVLADLAGRGVLVEAYGGDVLAVEVSAKEGTGLEELLDSVLLVTDATLDLTAAPSGPASGWVLDSWVDRGRGTSATLLVTSGELLRGDVVASGTSWGKLRTLEGTPFSGGAVVVTGLDSLPTPGERFEVLSAKDAQELVSARARHLARVEAAKGLGAKRFGTDPKVLELVLKASSSATLEVLTSVVKGLRTPGGVDLTVVRATSGVLAESDLLEGTTLVLFDVRASAALLRQAAALGVDVVTSDVIYRLSEALTDALDALKDPVYEDVVTGQLEVVALFKSSSVGTIAGCVVRDGSVRRDSSVRVLRGGREILRSSVKTLQRERQGVTEVRSPLECGASLGTDDLEISDLLEVLTPTRVG
jgi:translation initiation factor IF-2